MYHCPCCSGNRFEKCCDPVLKNESASTALVLMRSRYTAYYNGDAEYLFNTTHSKTRQEVSINEIKEWANENSWTKLEIVNVEKGNEKDKKGIVEFKAYFTDKKGVDQIHHEKSTFLKENGSWFYLEGIANPQQTGLTQKVLRNDPCPCGSRKKYKKCCG